VKANLFLLSVSAARRNRLNNRGRQGSAGAGSVCWAEMNNGLNTERALRGVFSTSSYITVGDPYAKKGVKDDREMGLQMSAGALCSPATWSLGSRDRRSPGVQRATIRASLLVRQRVRRARAAGPSPPCPRADPARRSRC
jgi:hypothetical protein